MPQDPPAADDRIRVPSPSLSRIDDPSIAPFSPASTLSPPPALSPDANDPRPAHLTFSATRPPSLKPTSNRKSATTGNTHPYTKTYLKRQLQLDEPAWTALVAQLIVVMDANSELLDSTATLAAQLTGMELLATLKDEEEDDEVQEVQEEGERSFLMYQVALFARRKALAKSGREQMVSCSPCRLLSPVDH